MFVYNLKVDKRKIKKYGIILGIIVACIFLVMLCLKLLDNNFIFKVDDELPSNDVNVISADNYANILKSVHDNLDNYVGQKISFTGYVYRVYDFNSNQFVLARNMIISSDFQTVVIGFLCESHETCNYENGAWVCIEGEITKGNYHGEIPVINVTSIKGVDKPENEYVYPPDDSYIPTSAIF